MLSILLLINIREKWKYANKPRWTLPIVNTMATAIAVDLFRNLQQTPKQKKRDVRCFLKARKANCSALTQLINCRLLKYVAYLFWALYALTALLRVDAYRGMRQCRISISRRSWIRSNSNMITGLYSLFQHRWRMQLNTDFTISLLFCTLHVMHCPRDSF